MEKEELINLWNSVNGISSKLVNAIIKETQDNPLILLNDDDHTGDDQIYDLPYGCIYGKYGSYIEGVVKSVNGNNVQLFMTDDNFGEIFEMETTSLSFDSLVEILGYLNDRN